MIMIMVIIIIIIAIIITFSMVMIAIIITQPIATVILNTRFCFLSSFPRSVLVLQVGRFDPVSSLFLRQCFVFFLNNFTFLIIVRRHQPIFSIILAPLVEHLTKKNFR